MNTLIFVALGCSLYHISQFKNKMYSSKNNQHLKEYRKYFGTEKTVRGGRRGTGVTQKGGEKAGC